jgi:hypothetical protein
MAIHSINIPVSINCTSENINQSIYQLLSQSNTMEIELLSRETIKPSSPTPSHLRIYPLSFIDNIFFRLYVPVIFFYNPNEGSHRNSKISLLPNILKLPLNVMIKVCHFWSQRSKTNFQRFSKIPLIKY